LIIRQIKFFFKKNEKKLQKNLEDKNKVHIFAPALEEKRDRKLSGSMKKARVL
jgi:hypothetical protein